VSFAAVRECQRFVAQAAEKGAENAAAPKTFAMIKIREHRDLSEALAERTGIRHESPQLFLLDHGEVAWCASHWQITVAALAEALAACAAPSSLPAS
jgi:bacillithiol system protein YtxJ